MSVSSCQRLFPVILMETEVQFQDHSILVHRAVLAASSLGQLMENSLETISIVDISLH